ncbi:molybdopterin synthase catalytic subunit MoaE [Amphibiibacter pelophylacis]|uniref:Molybdopterin synthase catalytic subunit MoaE n=1 Tax=Amphibiibacter pelophylacis TaxID=1799477 RepID=A0ACC6NZB7_9BURK
MDQTPTHLPTTVHIAVQAEAFDVGAAYGALAGRADVGAVVQFVGRVRDLPGSPTQALELEHYPGMTEHALHDLAQAAQARWPLQHISIVHRIGRLEAAEDIVLVQCASAHRAAAFEAAQFLMDRLKTDAPFWKKNHSADGSHWVDAKASDETAAQRWV